MGGHAFSGTRSINRSEINSTLNWLIENTNRKDWHTTLLGSSRSRKICGDIDVVVDDKKTTMNDVIANLKKFIPEENIKSKPQLNQLYTKIKIPGTNDFVQVDYMFGEPKLLSWTYWSPDEDTSKYKGLHRTELLKAIAKALSNYTAWDGDKLLARIGYTLYLDKGLTYGARFRPSLKSNLGYSRDMINVISNNIDSFNKLYPQFNYSGSFTFSNVPEIISILFSNEISDSGFFAYSYESIFKMTKFLRPNLLELILEIYYEQLNDLKADIPKI